MSKEKYHWCQWVFKTLLHASIWGTDDYTELNADERKEFADMVSAGDLFETFENLKRRCVRDGIELPAAVLSELSLGAVKPGMPLPAADRNRLAELAKEVYALIVKYDDRILPDEVGKPSKPANKKRRGRNDARDKYIYNARKKKTAKEVLAEVDKCSKWEPLDSVQGVDAAAKRYANNHELPWPHG